MAREPKPCEISPVYHHPRCCCCVGKTPDAFFVCEVGDRKPSKINQEDCNPLGTELKLTPTDKIWITYVCERSLTITEIFDTSVKLKRTSRFPRPFQTTGDVCDSVFTLKSAKFRTTRKEWKSKWIRENCWKNRSWTSYERYWARSCMAG